MPYHSEKGHDSHLLPIHGHKTEAPAANMFSTEIIGRSNSSITPTAASAVSLFNIPIYAVLTML